jgi:hypothetical protein
LFCATQTPLKQEKLAFSLLKKVNAVAVFIVAAHIDNSLKIYYIYIIIYNTNNIYQIYMRRETSVTKLRYRGSLVTIKSNKGEVGTKKDFIRRFYMPNILLTIVMPRAHQRLIRILLLCLVLIIVAGISLTDIVVAADANDTLRLLLPYPIAWVERAAAAYETKTGVQVVITTSCTSEVDIVPPGVRHSTTSNEALMRENLLSAIEEDSCDLVYTWGIPAELIADTRILVDLNTYLSSDSDIDLADYHSGVMSAPLSLARLNCETV